MGISRNWFRKLRRNITILHTPTLTASHQQITNRDSTATEQSLLPQHHRLSSSSPQNKLLTQRDIAAIKIQAIFRGHLARRAFRALKSLVKLQALVRGVCVRRQTRIALHCMHALVRLQVRVRARQLLGQGAQDLPLQS